ncbi:MAG: sulfatase, partial [Actinomycetota bacterium]
MPGDSPRRTGASALWPIAAAAVVVALFYAGPFGTRPLRVPVADDSFFYVWALRFVGSFGLADSHLAARPAFPLFGSTIGALSHASPWVIAVATPIAMAAGLALAGGAIAMRWGVGRKAALFVVLAGTSAVVARLVAGKTENLLTLWLIAAIIALALWGEGRPRFWGIAALSVGAAISEWPIVVPFLGLMIAARVWNGMSPTTENDRTLQSALWPTLLGLGAGLAIVFLWNGSGIGSAIQVLPPDFVYRRRLSNEVAYVWPSITVPLALAGWWISRRPRGDRERSMMHLFSLWLLATVLALSVGYVGLRLPTYRAITFALPVSLAVAAAPFIATRIRGYGVGAGRFVAVAVAVVSVLPATALWYRDLDGRTSLDQMSQFALAVRIATQLPDDQPPVVVVNRRAERAYFYQRLADTLLPPDRRKEVLVFMGTSEDALAGRPTQGHGADFDALTRQLFVDIAPALRAGAPILTGRSLDYPGFEAAIAGGARQIGGGDVAVLRGPIPLVDTREIPVVPIRDWWHVWLIALFALVAVALAGAGWTFVVLPKGPSSVRAMLAPAFGVTSLAVASLILTHVGIRPAGIGAVAAVAVAAGASVAAAVAGGRLRLPPRTWMGRAGLPPARGRRTSVRRPVLAATTGVLLLVGTAVTDASASRAPARPVASANPARPNVVVILTDDQRWDTLAAMPHVRSLLGGHGVTFKNAFVTTPLCCPSRAGLLTGRYSRNLGVYSDLPPNGGAESFDDTSTLATWLNDAGYTTGFVGKYLNDYQAIREHIPPGWDEWTAIASQPAVNYYGFTLNENGSFVHYDRRPANYSTTVLGGIATRFLRTASPPFFLHVAPVAPHAPAIPAREDAGRIVTPFTEWSPSFNEADVSDKPWGDSHPRLSPAKVSQAGDRRERMLRSLLAVDRAVGEMARALAKRGQLDNTIIVFTSDNGYLLGEHRLSSKKIWPYEESIRVPLVIRTPWATKASVDSHLVLNIDIAPTLAELARVTPDVPPDGVILVPLLRGQSPPWRTAFIDEFLGRDQRFNGGPPPFVGVRTTRYLFVEYRTGWRELY